MDARKFAGENYLKLADIPNGQGLEFEIAVIKENEKFGKLDLVSETGDHLGLNATNTRILMKNYGPDTDRWVGQTIELTRGIIQYQGKDQAAILIKPVSPPIDTGEKVKAKKKLKDELDDQVPF